MKMKPKVLITDLVWRDVEVKKRIVGEAPADVSLAPAADEATLADIVGEYDGIITNFGQITRKVLDKQGRVKKALGHA